MLFLDLSKKWFNIFVSSKKYKDKLKFLNKINIKNTIENSKPAKPRIKKVNDVRFISSFIEPNNTLKVYKLTHEISE